MPVTVLHFVYVWPILRRLNDNRLVLVIGCMIPDLEIPLLALMGYTIPRGIAHSIIGALTIDSFITLVIAKLFYSIKKVKEILGINDRLNTSLFYSWMIASIGALTHVSIDYLHHTYNPILWPFSYEYIEGPLTTLLDYTNATIMLHVISLAILIMIIAYSLTRLKVSLWKLLSSPKLLYRVIVEPDSRIL